MYLHKDVELFTELIKVTSNDSGIPEEYIEKDYFVSLLLKNIVKEQPNIVFKGGTSLSKCYGLINRFSEDIDINLKIDFKATNRDKEALKNAIIRAIEISEMGLINPEEIRTRRDFNKYEVEYSTVQGTGDIIRPHLLVESYLSLKSFPCERKLVNNYILEFLIKENELELIKQYDLEPFEVDVQSLNRTFIDKLLAICDYHERGQYTQNSRL